MPEVGAADVAGRALAATDDLAGVVDSEGGATFTPKGTKIGHDAVFPQESMDSLGRGEAVANNLTGIVDSLGGAVGATEGAQLGDDTIGPQDGWGYFADDLPGVVDGVGVAPAVVGRSEVGHDALVPDEGMDSVERGATVTDYLAASVDGAGRAAPPA